MGRKKVEGQAEKQRGNFPPPQNVKVCTSTTTALTSQPSEKMKNRETKANTTLTTHAHQGIPDTYKRLQAHLNHAHQYSQQDMFCNEG
jgi:hypothetical protein